MDSGNSPAISASREEPHQTTTSIYIPNEILDHIFWYVCDRSPFRTHKHRLVCSLVCHQWRAVLLPRLFDRISLRQHETRTASKFLHFILDTKAFAFHMRSLTLDQIGIDIGLLSAVIGSLPCLSCISLHYTEVTSQSSSFEGGELSCNNHVLENLSYQCLDCSANFFRALALFSHITRLCIMDRSDNPSEDYYHTSYPLYVSFGSSAQNTSKWPPFGDLQICELDIGPGACPGFLNFNFPSPTIQSLTALTFHTYSDFEHLSRLNELLQVAGPTLKCLSLIAEHHWHRWEAVPSTVQGSCLILCIATDSDFWKTELSVYNRYRRQYCSGWPFYLHRPRGVQTPCCGIRCRLLRCGSFPARRFR